ncbi:hypothetical protein CU633_17975 [Bacillus sp. V3-13]|uniref:PH domain-containing protein n=1 Tax=Bacillus sp. V3-13 TaxID=2053728 RepID=UPI000C770430|nr:PH domain-containing protein [Bacillus sp. V3-13]PLR75958.1 hypothetical protein CU633_17975 [Bacillus sp. V3-13]
MGIYRTVCHKVEDIFVKVLAKNQDPAMVKERVVQYRAEKEKLSQERKASKQQKRAEQQQLQLQRREEKEAQRRQQEERERREVEALISKVLDNSGQGYSLYEYNEIKKNKPFFLSLVQRVFEPNEKALTFIFCEFDKSSKKEIKGYLIPTNKRVLFLTKDLNHMDKFRYQTVINVNWFKDGILERGLKIQYGKRKLEFDEIYDQDQMQKVGNTILNRSTNRTV